MSVKATHLVWEHSRASGVELLVLLAIADYVNDDGRAWPSQTTIARKARCTDRTVRRAVDRLVELGELAVLREGGGRGRSSVYRLTVKRTQRPPSDEDGNVDIDAETRTSTTVNVDTAMSTEPSRTTNGTVNDDDARAHEATESSPASLRASVAAEAPTNVKAKIDAIATRVAADGFTTLQAQLVGQALMDDEAGTVALAEHALAASKPAGFFLSALRRGQHVGFVERAAAPKAKRPGDAAAERFVARAIAARERQEAAR